MRRALTGADGRFYCRALPPPEEFVIPRFRRLESRLLASFLLLAAVPSLLLTLVAIWTVRWAADRIQSPAIEESFWSAATLSRELRARLQSDAGDLFAAFPDAPASAEEEADLRAELEARGASFLSWLLPDGSVVTVDVDPRSGDVGQPRISDWEALAAGETPPERRYDTLRFFDPGEIPPAESTEGAAPADSLLATPWVGVPRAVGFRMDPATARAMESAGLDYTRYRQLFVWEAVWKRALFLALGGAFVVTAVAAFLAARVTARRVSRPVVRLARSADRLAAGDLAHRADVAAEGEVADLVRSFNRMTEQLERSRDELLRMERISAWRDVARRVAHEIRNPLTPIRLALHRLAPRLEHDTAGRECLTAIAEEIDSLERLSSTFAEFAKLPEARLARMDFARVVLGVVELHQGLPHSRVEYEGPEELWVAGDRDLLRRAATNLVKNAIEALVERPGRVRVSLDQQDGRARLEVADDGPGIPADLQALIGRPGVSGKTGGSGLGLAMVQRIAADHRGTLSWQSSAAGTRFRLEIPVEIPEHS